MCYFLTFLPCHSSWGSNESDSSHACISKSEIRQVEASFFFAFRLSLSMLCQAQVVTLSFSYPGSHHYRIRVFIPWCKPCLPRDSRMLTVSMAVFESHCGRTFVASHIQLGSSGALLLLLVLVDDYCVCLLVINFDGGHGLLIYHFVCTSR